MSYAPIIIQQEADSHKKEKALHVVSFDTGLSVRSFDISKKSKFQADSLGDAILNDLEPSFYLLYEND